MCEVYSTSLILHFHIKMLSTSLPLGGWIRLTLLVVDMIGVTVSIKLTQTLKAI